MKLRLKLSLIVIAIIAVTMTVSSMLILRQASTLQTSAAYDHALQVAQYQTTDIGRRMETVLSTAKSLAQIFGEYHSIPAEQRRGNFDDMIWSLLSRNEEYEGIWTAWFPNALDGMDNRSGQYLTSFTRRNGPIQRQPNGFEDWQAALADLTDEASISDPVWRTVGNKEEVPVVTLIYPIKSGETGKLAGLVGINYITASQAYADEIGEELYNGAGVAGIYSNSGVIVGHDNRARVKSTMRDNPQEQILLGAQLDTVVNAIKNGAERNDPLIITAHSPVLKTDLHLIYYPIQLQDVKNPWCLMIGIPMNEVTKAVRQMTVFTIVLAFIFTILAAVIVFFVATSITKPIISVSRTLKDISEGEGDLTKTISVKGKDEVADLARYFNLTLEKIRGLVATIKRQSGNLSEIGAELASNMTESAAAINQITSNIHSIKGRVISQSASVSETNATMEQITVNIDKLNEHVEYQTTSVAQSSSAVEEMIANIQNVTATLGKNAENVNALTDASSLGRSGIEEVSADIQAIAKESASLLEINAVMQHIAAETNILSMNAAIEAAHAGEAGRGFAVVANEIRKLAQSASAQSKTTSGVLKRVKESIDKISHSTGSVLERFEAIDSSVKTVADQTENIRNAMEEQGEGSKQILEAVARLNDITRQVRSGSSEMRDGSKEVIQESKNLEMVSQEISGGMNEMASGAEQINAAVNRVSELTGQNRESINMLVREVSRFKID
jgi:methyl-accepting chemotaxis protein